MHHRLVTVAFRCCVQIFLLIIIIIIIFGAHQHKAAGQKIKLNKIKMVTMASHSMTIVSWKETASLLLFYFILFYF